MVAGALVIKNGYVYDPLNGVNGEVMDIYVENGKIVEKVSEREAKVIDAKGKIVMPGGVDLHSHIAGTKVNAGRIIRPEDHRRLALRKGKTRSGVGYSVPSTYTTGYLYSLMGYTTVFEPATPPLKTRHTHEELNDIPMLDKACFPLFANNWAVMKYTAENAVEECAAYVAWVLRSVKGYAVKGVNPGGVYAWGWGKNVESLDDQVPHFGVTPREIVRMLVKVCKLLNLPHQFHLHTNNLGKPGNYRTVIETIEAVSDLAEGKKPVLHITHVQFCGYKGDSWIKLKSGAEEIAKLVNNRSYVTIDTGCVWFGDTTTMTADGPFQFILYQLTGNKWVNSDVELETGAGIVPIRYRRRSFVNALQWSIGLELALLVKDPWRVYVTTDHPNGAPFIRYPDVIACLMSKEAREKELKKVNRRARRRSLLPSIEREYTLYEVAIVTRAGPAKILGLKSKGHLGVGADADVAVYDLDPEKIDLSRDYEVVKKAFSKAYYTVKGGEVVVKEGEVVREVWGGTFYVNPEVPVDLEKKMLEDVKEFFDRWYTVKMENYPIEKAYLEKPLEVQVKTAL